MISYHEKSLFARETPFTAGFSRYETRSLFVISQLICKYVWSPIVFRDDYRCERNFEVSYFCALDFDSPEFSLREACKVFCDTQHIIATTRSHQKPKGEALACDRFRVVIPWEKPVSSLGVYKYLMRKVTERFDCDTACKDGARFFFPCLKVVSLSLEGYCEASDVDLSKLASDGVNATPRRAHVRASKRIMSPRAAVALSQVIPVGERNNTIYYLGCELARLGVAFDDALQRILTSPTYKNVAIDTSLRCEIVETLKRGFRKELGGVGAMIALEDRESSERKI